MTIRHINQFSQNVAVLMLLTLGFSSAGAGQATSDKEAAPELDKSLEVITESASERVPEEIIVYGETNVIILRNALNLAQESFFDMYNTLNSDDDFDVECKKRQQSISQRARTHRCMPVFALKYAAQAGSGFHSAMANAFGGAASSGAANLEYQARVKAREKEMWAEIAELAKTNSQFREEIKKLMAAGRAMDAEKERRGPCPKIFCRD